MAVIFAVLFVAADLFLVYECWEKFKQLQAGWKVYKAENAAWTPLRWEPLPPPPIVPPMVVDVQALMINAMWNPDNVGSLKTPDNLWYYKPFIEVHDRDYCVTAWEITSIANSSTKYVAGPDASGNIEFSQGYPCATKP